MVETDNRVSELRRLFQQLMDNVPAEYGPRQRCITEHREGALFLQITSTFKLPDARPNGNGHY